MDEEAAALRSACSISSRGYLESTCPVSCGYGRRALKDMIAVGLVDVQAEGRCPIVPGGNPLAGGFLRLTLEKLREQVRAGGVVSREEFEQAVTALQDPGTTVVAPMTVAAWGRRP
jgi:hypothetical protein